jgi:low affinity Fe/Cu permease
MVFLIQNTQNRDGAAMQAKLDELIRVTEAQNQFIGIEHLTETEVEEIRDKCEKAVKRHAMESASRQGRQNAEAQAAQELKKSFGKTAPANARKSSPAKSGRTSAKAGGAVR